MNLNKTIKYESKTILIDNDIYAQKSGITYFTIAHEIRTLLFAI